MDYARLTAEISAFLTKHTLNYVQPEDAMRDDLVGMQLFDAPVFSVADADDPLFAALRRPEAVHPDYMLPGDWLPGARRVISFFAPYTERIRAANAEDFRMPADEWQHGRYDGELLMVAVRKALRDRLIEAGHGAVAPLHDERFAMLGQYAPNWAERHTGYICGLGTFGLSKGLITEKGVAGRLGSVVTTCDLPVTVRPYDSLYAYCDECGQCATHCPVKCIDPARGLDAGKAHPPCDAFLAHIRGLPPRGASARTRYGCGKCQVAVPCQDGIPQKLR